MYIKHALTKKTDEYYILGSYDGGKTWDEEAASTSRKEAADEFRAYQDNGGGMYEFRTRRVVNPYYGRFYVGQTVRVHPATDAFMMGVRYARVVKVGRDYVHVVWSMNEAKKFKFLPEFLSPMEEEE